MQDNQEITLKDIVTKLNDIHENPDSIKNEKQKIPEYLNFLASNYSQAREQINSLNLLYKMTLTPEERYKMTLTPEERYQEGIDYFNNASAKIQDLYIKQINNELHSSDLTDKDKVKILLEDYHNLLNKPLLEDYNINNDISLLIQQYQISQNKEAFINKIVLDQNLFQKILGEIKRLFGNQRSKGREALRSSSFLNQIIAERKEEKAQGRVS
jgi:hypothetical protein